MQISNKDNRTVGVFVHIVWLCTLCAHCLHCLHCVHAHCALVTAARPDFPHHSQSALELEAVSLCKQSQQEGEEEEGEWTKKDLQIIDMNVCSFSMNDSLVQKKVDKFSEISWTTRRLIHHILELCPTKVFILSKQFLDALDRFHSQNIQDGH